MIYVLVALKNELGEHQLDESKYKVWYTGVGKVNATFSLTRKFGKLGSYIPYSLVINYILKIFIISFC